MQIRSVPQNSVITQAGATPSSAVTPPPSGAAGAASAAGGTSAAGGASTGQEAGAPTAGQSAQPGAAAAQPGAAAQTESAGKVAGPGQSVATSATSGTAPTPDIKSTEVMLAAVRQDAAARPGGLAPLMADLAQVADTANSARLPAAAQTAIGQILGLRLSAQDTPKAQDISRAFRQSGLFTEAHAAAATQQTGSGTAATTIPTDLKSLLLVLQQSLRAMIPGTQGEQGSGLTSSARSSASANTTSSKSAAPASSAASTPSSKTASPTSSAASAATTNSAAPKTAAPAPASADSAAPKTAGPASSADSAATTNSAAPKPAPPASGSANSASSKTASPDAGRQPNSASNGTLPEQSATSSKSASPAPDPASGERGPGLTSSAPGTASANPTSSKSANPASGERGSSLTSSAPGTASANPTSSKSASPASGASPATDFADAWARAGYTTEAAGDENDPDILMARALTAGASLPRTGAAPTAQAAQHSALSQTSDIDTIVRYLLFGSEAALSHQKLLQFASLQGSDGKSASQPHWMFEIPVATPTGTAVAQFAIDKDGGGENTDGTRKEPTWRVRFSINIDPLGPVHVSLAQSKTKTWVSLWSPMQETMKSLREGAEDLTQALTTADLAAEISFTPVKTTTPAAQRTGHFLDNTS